MKKILLLKDPAELRVLGNEYAYAILDMIRKEEHSSSELANVLDIKAQHITYYLNRLEEKGLAEVVRTGKRREKFFRATAEKFVIYSDIGEDADLLNRSVNAGYFDTIQFSSSMEKIRKYIKMILSGTLNVQPGSKVVINFTEDSMMFLREFIRELRDLQAQIRLVHNSTYLSEHLWNELSIEGFRCVYQDLEELTEWSDIEIILGAHRIFNLSEVPEDRLSRLLPIRQSAISSYMTRKDLERVQVYLPPYNERSMHDPHLLESLDMFWSAASLEERDYKRMRKISDLLLKCEDLEIITGDDLRLNVRLDADHYLLDAGPYSIITPGLVYNMPAGEFSVLPAEGGMNGRIFLEKATRESTPCGTTLTIENGIVTSASTESGEDLLKSRLEDFGIDGRRVGKICFGLNPAIRDPNLLPDLRSLMCGSVNLTFGDNSDVGGDIKEIVGWELTSHHPSIFSGDEIILHKNRYELS